jgi:hypothetical protein
MLETPSKASDLPRAVGNRSFIPIVVFRRHHHGSGLTVTVRRVSGLPAALLCIAVVPLIACLAVGAFLVAAALAATAFCVGAIATLARVRGHQSLSVLSKKALPERGLEHTTAMNRGEHPHLLGR